MRIFLAGTAFSDHALVEVGLGVPHHVAQQFGELGAVFGLFKSVALEGLGNLGVAFAVGLAAHGQIHADLGGLSHVVGVEVLDHVLTGAFGDAKDMLGDKVQGSTLVNDFPFDDLLALRAALGGFLSFVYVPADGADEFFLHSGFIFELVLRKIANAKIEFFFEIPIVAEK